jgi:hypothetical protein
MTPEIVVVIIVAVVVVGAVGTRLFKARLKGKALVHGSSPLGNGRPGISRTPFDSPLTRLRFVESLDPGRFVDASMASAAEGLTRVLANQAADGVVVTINAVRFVQQGAELLVSVSADGKRLLDLGRAIIPVHKASGARLPILVDASTGRIIENLKEVRVSRVTSKLANITSMVVGAAHLVAGADLAKRLARVDTRIEYLALCRRFDQVARLERGPQRHSMWRPRGARYTTG